VFGGEKAKKRRFLRNEELPMLAVLRNEANLQGCNSDGAELAAL
jgi:hypothetical protein